MSIKKEIKDILADLITEGWRVIKGSRHYQAFHPARGIVTIAATPSDIRALKNIRGEIKRLKKSHGEA